MLKVVIKGIDDEVCPTENSTIMLSEMNIDNQAAYRTLKQLGAIVCIQNKEVAHFMAYQGQLLVEIK